MKKIILFLLAIIFMINTASAAENASVELHGEKTDVVLGEDIILKLSAVNIITKPVMTVQVILIPPSGMSVSSSEFVTSGAGQFTSTFNISTGAGRDIEVRIKTNQIGDFNVKGRVIYYFGGDISTAEESTPSLSIKVRAPPAPVKTGVERVTGLSTNELIVIGFATLALILILYKLIRKSREDAAEFGRQQKVREAETDLLIEQKESEADFEEAKRGIEALRLLKQAKAEGRKGVQEEDDKGHTIKFGRSGSITESGSIIQRSNIGAGAMKKCPHCGAMMPRYASFCGECGKKIG